MFYIQWKLRLQPVDLTNVNRLSAIDGQNEFSTNQNSCHIRFGFLVRKYCFTMENRFTKAVGLRDMPR